MEESKVEEKMEDQQKTGRTKEKKGRMDLH